MDNFHLFTFGRVCPHTVIPTSNPTSMEVDDVKSANAVAFDQQSQTSSKGNIKFRVGVTQRASSLCSRLGQKSDGFKPLSDRLSQKSEVRIPITKRLGPKSKGRIPLSSRLGPKSNCGIPLSSRLGPTSNGGIPLSSRLGPRPSKPPLSMRLGVKPVVSTVTQSQSENRSQDNDLLDIIEKLGRARVQDEKFKKIDFPRTTVKSHGGTQTAEFTRIQQARKHVHWDEESSGLASDEPKEFDVDKMEERAERFENLELLKRRTRKFEETVAPVLVSIKEAKLKNSRFDRFRKVEENEDDSD